MALDAYKSALRHLIQKMQEEGLVNNHFEWLQSLKDSLGRDYVAKAVVVYCMGVKSLFTSMSLLLEEQDAVDFAALETYTSQLIDSSNRMGVEHFKILCENFLKDCQMLDVKQCARALISMKSAFCKLQQKLENFLEMERNIIAYEAGCDTRIPRLLKEHK